MKFYTILIYSMLLFFPHTLIKSQTVQLNFPNGGNDLLLGSLYEITWNDNIDENVKIDLWKGGTFDEGGTQIVIANSTESDGSYSWSIPNNLTEGNDYKIRVKSVVDPSNELLFDYSDENFNIIKPLINIYSPNGNNTWRKGETYEITWISNTQNNVNIYLYKGGTAAGGGIKRVIASSIANNGSYFWEIENDIELGDDYKIQIQDILYPNNEFYMNYSTEYFTITDQSVTIISPNGNENWYKDEIYEIKWTDNIVENVRIDLFNESTYENISSSTESDGSFLWHIPGNLTASEFYKIRVQSVDEPLYLDFSNENFTIAEPLVKLNTPNGGEYLYLGNSYEITWNDFIDENVRIDLWKGGTYDEGGTQIVITNSTDSDGSYLWNIPSELVEGDDYKIRVKSVVDPSNELLYDYSDNNISIIEKVDDNNNTPEDAIIITIPYEQNSRIGFDGDNDWFNFEIVNDTNTYRIYNTSLENIDTELILYEGFWEENSHVVLMRISAEDDNSGGNHQPLIEYKQNSINYYGKYWLKVKISDEVNESEKSVGDYKLHIYQLCKKLNLKMFLQGVYDNDTHIMNNQLRSNVPLSSPFIEDSQNVSELPENIVDWILVELRDKDDNLKVVASRSAFLLNTGIIVDVDGISDLQFGAPSGRYYVVVKHRNHLPVMSSELIDISN